MNPTANKQRVQALFWHALTPLHAGTGQDAASIIDLPIAREKSTHYPVIPASSIKGVMRDGREGLDSYGYIRRGEQGFESKAADLSFTDGRILCLPVRSFRGTFAWVSCPHVLHRLERDRKALGLPSLWTALPELQAEQCMVTQQSRLAHQKRVILEDLDLQVTSEQCQKLGQALAQVCFETEPEQKSFLERFLLVSNEVFDFLCETATEVQARIKLDAQQKTVQAGGLWYEEYVPAEALFSSFVISETGSFADLPAGGFLQLGGKASIGKGLLRLVHP